MTFSPDMHEKTLSFQELRHWLEAARGRSFSIHIALARGIVVFLEGPIDTVMRFEADEDHGLLVEGAGRAWTLDLSEPEFLSATLWPVPDSFTTQETADQDARPRRRDRSGQRPRPSRYIPMIPLRNASESVTPCWVVWRG